MPLYAAGSNGDGQLGVGHTDDIREWTPCVVADGAFPPRGAEIVRCVSTASATLVLCRERELTLYASGALWPGWAPSRFERVRWEEVVPRQGRLLDVGACWDCVYVVLATTDGHEMWALGTSNTYGQWGTTAQGGLAHRVELEAACSDVWWAASPLPPLDGRIVVHAVAGGVRHVLVELSVEGDGVQAYGVVGWGHARHGQLSGMARGAVQATPAFLCAWPVRHDGLVMALGMQHSVVAWTASGEAQPPRGTVWAWGRDAACELPPPAVAASVACPRGVHAFYLDGVRGVCCLWKSTVVWSDVVVACGRASHAQTCVHGRACAPSDEIAGGSEHGVWRTADGALGWGWNEHGNLPGDAGEVRDVSLVWRGAAAHVYAGYGSTWVLSA